MYEFDKLSRDDAGLRDLTRRDVMGLDGTRSLPPEELHDATGRERSTIPSCEVHVVP